MDTEATKTEEAVMETTQNPSPSDINDWDFEEGPFSPPPFKQQEEVEPMFTIIDTHTNESVKAPTAAIVELLSDEDAQWDKTNEQLEAEAEPITTEGEPVLFDTEREAADFAAAQHLDGRRYAIVATDDIIDEEV